MRQTLLREGGQIGRFLIVGGLSVLTYYSLFIGLTELAGLWYVTSSVIAFVVYYCVQFALQKYWAFRNRGRDFVKQQLTQFTAISVANWCVNTTLLYVAVQYFGANYIVAQVFLTVVVSVIAYFVLRYIFRSR